MNYSYEGELPPRNDARIQDLNQRSIDTSKRTTELVKNSKSMSGANIHLNAGSNEKQRIEHSKQVQFNRHLNRGNRAHDSFIETGDEMNNYDYAEEGVRGLVSGMAIGTLVGGPIGTLAGGAIGHAIQEKKYGMGNSADEMKRNNADITKYGLRGNREVERFLEVKKRLQNFNRLDEKKKTKEARTISRLLYNLPASVKSNVSSIAGSGGSEFMSYWGGKMTGNEDENEAKEAVLESFIDRISDKIIMNDF